MKATKHLRDCRRKCPVHSTLVSLHRPARWWDYMNRLGIPQPVPMYRPSTIFAYSLRHYLGILYYAIRCPLLLLPCIGCRYWPQHDRYCHCFLVVESLIDSPCHKSTARKSMCCCGLEKNLVFCLLNIFRCVNSPKAF